MTNKLFIKPHKHWIRKFYLTIHLALFFPILFYAQQHDNIWILGYGGGEQTPDNDDFGLSILDFSGDTLQITDNQVGDHWLSIANVSMCNESGELIFYSNGASVENANFVTMQNESKRGWDGMFKDEEAPEAVYVVIVEFLNNNGEVQREVGTLTLIR